MASITEKAKLFSGLKIRGRVASNTELSKVIFRLKNGARVASIFEKISSSGLKNGTRAAAIELQIRPTSSLINKHV